MDLSEAVAKTGVHGGVRLSSHNKYVKSINTATVMNIAFVSTYLSTALDDIKRANSGVGKTAGKDTSNHALCIVASVMNVTHFVCLVYLV